MCCTGQPRRLAGGHVWWQPVDPFFKARRPVSAPFLLVIYAGVLAAVSDTQRWRQRPVAIYAGAGLKNRNSNPVLCGSPLLDDSPLPPRSSPVLVVTRTVRVVAFIRIVAVIMIMNCNMAVKVSSYRSCPGIIEMCGGQSTAMYRKRGHESTTTPPPHLPPWDQ